MYSYLGAFNLALHKGLHDSWAEGYKLMWFQFTPARLMFLNKKVTTLEDFKGLKISGVSGVWVNLPELLGGTSVAIPGSDAYMALERGVVDGRVSMPDYVLSQSLYEVVDYCPWFPITGTGLFAVGMTMEKWNELPVDVQLIMEQLNQEAQWEWMDRYYISNEEYRHMLEETGIEVYDISDEEKERWTAALNPLLESLVKQYEEKGLPINELLETYKRFY
jgi:TRAP-type C4-dicarboxylate transport system substrate-binding protein